MREMLSLMVSWLGCDKETVHQAVENKSVRVKPLPTQPGDKVGRRDLRWPSPPSSFEL